MMPSNDVAPVPSAPPAALPIDDWKKAGRGVAVVTAYDALFARLADDAGADAILVGDSLGPAILAVSESEVTLQDMVHHGTAVRRGLSRASLILDVPPRVAGQSPRRAAAAVMRAAARVGAAAVKIEGAGRHELAVICAVLDAGVRVVGHIARRDGNGVALRHAATALGRLGLPAIVLVGIPADVAADITASVAAATISAGSGPACDGALVNALEVSGLFRSAHSGTSSITDVPAGPSTASLLAAFCAETQLALRPLPSHTAGRKK